MQAHPIHDPNRRLHDIDEHIRILVVEKSDMMGNDENDNRVLKTDKVNENLDNGPIIGIFSSYCMIVFASLETGDVNTMQTIYLRDHFCFCNVCGVAEKAIDYEQCTYKEDMGSLRMIKYKNLGARKDPPMSIILSQYTAYLKRDGPLIDGERIIVRIKGGGIGYLTSLPEMLLKNRSAQKVTYKRGDVIVTIDTLIVVPTIQNRSNPTPEGMIDYIKNGNNKMNNITVLLSNIILPPTESAGIISRGQLTPLEILTERIDSRVVVRINSEHLQVLIDQEDALNHL